MVEDKEIGKVFSYFSRVGVAAIKLSDTLKVGNVIHIKGATTDIKQTIDTMEIERKSVVEAKAGDHIGIKIQDKVRPNDTVYLVE